MTNQPPPPGATPVADGTGLARWGLGSLQGRLLWSMVLVLVLALGGLGLRTASDAAHRLQQEENAKARALARSVALTLVNPLLTRQLDQVEEAMLRMALLPGLRELRVTDAQGRVISHVSARPGAEPVVQVAPQPPLALPQPPQPRVDQHRQADGTLAMVAWYPVGEPRPVGWVQAVHALDELDALQREVVWRTAIAGLVAAVLGSAGLLWLLRAPLAALRAAGRFALQLRQVDGTQLALPATAPLETRTLVESLNITSTRLAQRARDIEAAMAEVQRSRDALDQRNRELDALLTISPNGLLALDTRGRICFVNAAIGRFTGLDTARLVGQPLAALEQLLRSHCGVVEAWTGFEAAFAWRDGSEAGAPLLALARPQPRELRLERSRVDTAGIAWLISAQDVTHEREVERLKSEFLSTAAHELRTPMVSIHGFTELLLMRQMPPERQRNMLEAVHRNATLMNHVINELLDLSRIEARRGMDFERAPLDLAQLVREAVSDFRPPQGRSLPLLQGADHPVPTLGDRSKLRQVLLNLLSNAYKYSSAPGRVTVRLLVEPPADDGAPPRVGFSVRDQGIGMTPEQLARVFERFYRADPSGNVLGTGLGMSIVQEIVQLHGGRIALASTPGQGTTATVWLPSPASAEVPAPASAPASAPALA